MTVDISFIKQVASLGPEELQSYAMQALAKLQREARRISRPLGQRLKKSAKRSKTRMDMYIALAKVKLDQLPDKILICPGKPNCVSVDNTAAINQYIDAIARLRNTAMRALNRATRLTSPSIQAARAKSAKLGARIRSKGRALIENAQSIPKQMSICA